MDLKPEYKFIVGKALKVEHLKAEYRFRVGKVLKAEHLKTEDRCRVGKTKIRVIAEMLHKII